MHCPVASQSGTVHAVLMYHPSRASVVTGAAHLTAAPSRIRHPRGSTAEETLQAAVQEDRAGSGTALLVCAWPLCMLGQCVSHLHHARACSGFLAGLLCTTAVMCEVAQQQLSQLWPRQCHDITQRFRTAMESQTDRQACAMHLRSRGRRCQRGSRRRLRRRRRVAAAGGGQMTAAGIGRRHSWDWPGGSSRCAAAGGTKQAGRRVAGRGAHCAAAPTGACQAAQALLEPQLGGLVEVPALADNQRAAGASRRQENLLQSQRCGSCSPSSCRQL